MSKRASFATVIIGKSSLLREGIAKILRSANFRIIASVSSSNDLPSKVDAEQPLFLIIHTGDDFDFVAGQAEVFRNAYPDARIAIVADSYRPDELVQAFRVGVNGCFIDATTCEVFIRSLELVMMGETVLPPAFLSHVFGTEETLAIDVRPSESDKTIIVPEIDDPAPKLSPREKLILRCLIEGDSNKSIARKMDIAEATVKVHVKAILRKIRVHNRTQAAIWGMSNGCLFNEAGAMAPALPPALVKQLPASVGGGSQVSDDSSSAIEPTHHASILRIDHLMQKDSGFRAEAASRVRK
jgi:DNA-binding NarL/FixJ family response regulator